MPQPAKKKYIRRLDIIHYTELRLAIAIATSKANLLESGTRLHETVIPRTSWRFYGWQKGHKRNMYVSFVSTAFRTNDVTGQVKRDTGWSQLSTSDI